MAEKFNADLVVAFSTAGSPEEARGIATALVDEQLAACVNIVDNIHSIYRSLGGLASLRILDYENTKPSTSEIDQWLSHYRP